MKTIICFKKYGEAKYISHLDLQRTVARALRRSGIDVTYSQGYNPHIKMSFAFALKVGLSSEAEYLEIEMSDDVNIAKAEEKVKACFPSGLTVNWLKKKKENTKKLMASVAKAEYDIRFENVENIDAVKNAIAELLAMDSFELTKKTKKGPRTYDARPLIHSLNLDTKTGIIHAILSAQEAGTLDPKLLLDKILLVAKLDKEYTIIRKNLYMTVSDGMAPLSYLAQN